MRSGLSRREGLTVEAADESTRRRIYRCRHDVYAAELGQHPLNTAGALHDPLDACNCYIVVRSGRQLAGFISVTPPDAGSYSLDKYVPRDRWPVFASPGLFEIRLLTVLPPYRGTAVAATLMYAALRYVHAHGGREVIAMGRVALRAMYCKAGLIPCGMRVRSGRVEFEVFSGDVERMVQAAHAHPLVRRIERGTCWQLRLPPTLRAPCYHGGTFFEAIGDGFEDLSRRNAVINADVLDAWFDPAPGVIRAIREDLPWLLKTSPPTNCDGMIRAIAEARGVSEATLLPGGGSSDLMFLALRHWLRPGASVLMLDPTYGEYAHLVESVIGGSVVRFLLDRRRCYDVDPQVLRRTLQERRFELVILVNPNSPTGRHVPLEDLVAIIRSVDARTRFWIDETYIEYVGARESLERIAAASDNVVVCKSMSKAYALSGARTAYLCGPPEVVGELRALTPPWAVGLPSQVAAVMALRDPGYYADRYAQTHVLREELMDGLLRIPGVNVIPGVANFLLCHTADDLPRTATVVARCREYGLFIRDAQGMGTHMGPRAMRIAVKDGPTNRRMLEILRDVLSGGEGASGRS